MRNRRSRWFWIRPSSTRSFLALWAKSLLNALLFFGVFMVLLPWVADRLLPESLPLPFGARTWLAVVLFVAGLALWVLSLDAFSREGKGTPLPLDAPRNLVTSGLFGVLRNPIMAGELMVIWAEAVYFASLGILVYASAISVVAHLLVVHVEEPELRERFGDSYEAYCRRVPRWFPRRVRRGAGSPGDSDHPTAQ